MMGCSAIVMVQQIIVTVVAAVASAGAIALIVFFGVEIWRMRRRDIEREARQ